MKTPHNVIVNGNGDWVAIFPGNVHLVSSPDPTLSRGETVW